MAEEKRNRWAVNTILILSIVAFIGFSVIPIVGPLLSGNQAPTPARPTPTQSIAAAPKREDLEAQVKGYQAVLQREPDNKTALDGLLESQLQLIQLGDGKVTDVIPTLEKLVKLNPTETQYAVLLAQAKQQSKDPEGAADTYRQVLEKKPGDLQALNGFVNLQLQQKRPEAAIDLLQNTLKSAPQLNQAQPGSVDTVSIQVMLGAVYTNEKRYPEAIAIFDEAAKANKTDFRPALGKALTLKEQGKTEEAKAQFATAANLAPPQYKDQINQLAAAPNTSGPPAAAPSPTPSSAPSAAPVAPQATPSP